MLADGARADRKLVGDIGIGQTARDEPEHFDFPGGESHRCDRALPVKQLAEPIGRGQRRRRTKLLQRLPALRQQATRHRFVRRAVSRFMPGESLEDAVTAAQALAGSRIGTILTILGENVSDAAEADAEVGHYAGVLKRLSGTGLDAEISIKLTHLGLDLDPALADRNLARLAELAEAHRTRLWIDMENSGLAPITDARMEAFTSTVPTSCQMKRP